MPQIPTLSGASQEHQASMNWAHMPQPHETDMTMKSLPFSVSCTKTPQLSSEMPACVGRLYVGSSVVPVCVMSYRVSN